MWVFPPAGLAETSTSSFIDYLPRWPTQFDRSRNIAVLSLKKSFAMRFISFSILLAIFAIVFHGVVAQAPVAKNSVQGHLNRMRKHIQDAKDLREKASNCTDEKQRANYEKQAKMKDQHARARLKGFHNAHHLERAKLHKETEQKNLELAKNATNEKDKARYAYEARRAKYRYNWRMDQVSARA